jgi:glutamate-1-semialdehyde 2,1-aminomutase
LTTLEILQRDNPYPELERKTSALADGIDGILMEKGIPHTINRVGSMFSVFFHPGPVESYGDAIQADRDAFGRFFGRMLEEGIYLAPSAFESWFVGMAHSDEDIERTLTAVRKTL